MPCLKNFVNFVKKAVFGELSNKIGQIKTALSAKVANLFEIDHCFFVIKGPNENVINCHFALSCLAGKINKILSKKLLLEQKAAKSGIQKKL
jgi:hypothetical protein